MLRAAGQPDDKLAEHPKEDWSEVWTYRAESAGPVPEFEVRLDGDLVHAIDCSFSKDPVRPSEARFRALAPVGAAADELLARLGLPDSVYPQRADAVWFYWLRRSAVRPVGLDVHLRKGRVRRVAPPAWFASGD